MADRHDIIVTINEKGEVQLEVAGVKGSRCLEITKEIEEELGLVLNREKKSEYYQQEIDSTIDTKIEE